MAWPASTASGSGRSRALEPDRVDRAAVPLDGDARTLRDSACRYVPAREQPPRKRAPRVPAKAEPTQTERPRSRSARYAAQKGTDREILALRPRPERGPMRRAYLELLKLCLCDLAGARTLSVSRTATRARARQPGEVPGARPRRSSSLRARGSDWPFSGLTMVGLEAAGRPAGLHRVRRRRRRRGRRDRGGGMARRRIDPRPRDARFARRGRATVVGRRLLPGPAGARPGGLPEDRELDLSQVDFLAVPAEEVRAHFARFGLEQGVEFVEGFFDETLPELRGRRWSVIRLDGDTYEATWVGLESLYPGLSAGRLPDRRRLRADPGVPRGRRRFPARARDRRADREDRLERRALAPGGASRSRPGEPATAARPVAPRRARPAPASATRPHPHRARARAGARAEELRAARCGDSREPG